jgi:hypothetical protein
MAREHRAEQQRFGGNVVRMGQRRPTHPFDLVAPAIEERGQRIVERDDAAVVVERAHRHGRL